jgi:hypothetical protein
MSNNPLSLEEHRDLGQEMQKTRQHLRQISRMVLDVYGDNNRSVFAFEQLNLDMDRLIEELIKQALADCPGKQADTLYR